MRLGTSRFARGLVASSAVPCGGSERGCRGRSIVALCSATALGQISFDGRSAHLLVQQTRPYDEDAQPDFEKVIELDLVAGSRVKEQATTT